MVLTTGDNMMHLDDALPRAKRGGHSARTEDLMSLITRVLRNGDVVLVKGSNSQKLGLVVAALVGDESNTESNTRASAQAQSAVNDN
jgi:UDP-N-acetylmuramoyl-tripeptide--D-alanyl-D-alanine ligase